MERKRKIGTIGNKLKEDPTYQGGSGDTMRPATDIEGNRVNPRDKMIIKGPGTSDEHQVGYVDRGPGFNDTDIFETPKPIGSYPSQDFFGGKKNTPYSAGTAARTMGTAVRSAITEAPAEAIPGEAGYPVREEEDA